MNAHDACFPGKDGHGGSQSPLFFYNGNRYRRAASIMMVGQAPFMMNVQRAFSFTFRTAKNNMVEMGGAQCGGWKRHA